MKPTKISHLLLVFSILSASLATTDVSTITTSDGGSKITYNSGTRFGISVASAGDFNHDGFEDVIIGDDQKKEVYILYGGSSFPSTLDVGSMSSSQGVKLTYINGGSSQFGISVAAAGDFNHDGVSDVIIGSTLKKEAYILYGGSSFPSTLDVGSMTSSQGIKITYPLSGYNFALNVASAGDFNHDGISDVIIGVNLKQEVYILYGGSSLPSTLDVSSMTSSQGVKLTYTGGSQFGLALGSAGDFNHDGVSDVIIADFSTQEIYILYGSSSFPSTLDVGSMTSSQGVKITYPGGSQFGSSVASAGDFNHDGYSDVIIGDKGKKQAHIIYSGSSFPSTLDVGSMSSSQGVKLTYTSGTQFGYSVAAAGDFNHDGVSDVILGDNSKKEVYILKGSCSTYLYNGVCYFKCPPGLIDDPSASTCVCPSGTYVSDGKCLESSGNHNQSSAKVGKIVGAVLGSVFGTCVVVGLIMGHFRLKKKALMGKNAWFYNKRYAPVITSSDPLPKSPETSPTQV